MQRYHGYENVAPAHRGAVAAIGNFDGVHLGHQAVIGAARSIALRERRPLGVVTFEPHPRAFFQPDARPFRLMTAEARAHRLDKLGVEVLFEIPFGAALSALSHEAFMGNVLGRGLGLAHVVCGADFRFGKGRSGDAETLRLRGPDFGFSATTAPLVGDDERDFSSSAIRAALSEGRPGDAARMLGHWHRIEGPVEHGEKRGRAMGFPTINLALGDLHRPRYGVYTVEVDVLDGPHRGTYGGCASIGERPTFGENAANLEVFLLDFAGDLYGAEVSVALMVFQRGERKFDDVGALVAQMHADVDEARGHLAGVR